MRKKLLKLCLCTVLFVFALCSFTACKKVKSARAVFAPYYTAHTPSASEQKDAFCFPAIRSLLRMRKKTRKLRLVFVMQFIGLPWT